LKISLKCCSRSQEEKENRKRERERERERSITSGEQSQGDQKHEMTMHQEKIRKKKIIGIP